MRQEPEAPMRRELLLVGVLPLVIIRTTGPEARMRHEFLLVAAPGLHQEIRVEDVRLPNHLATVEARQPHELLRVDTLEQGRQCLRHRQGKAMH